ncbi:MAG: C-type lectin domain-containing protein, partial [Planctomycetota bacterium]
MSARRPFSDIPDASALRLAQSLRAQMPVTRTLARTRRAPALFALFLGLVLPMAAASRFMGASRSDIPRSPEMQMKSMAAVALATSGLITSIAAGDAVEWRVADGGNGHWYQLVHNGSYLCWSDANGRAITLGATLVSETSVAEHNFIAAQFISRDDAWSGRFGPWIGAHRVNGAWSWTTGESWTFSAWYPGEPNGGSFEPVASYIAAGEGGGCGRTTTWNDWVDCGQVNSSGCDVGVWNYIVEWSADCNNDGIVDYGQCRDGSLPDFNGNNIPDCCEQGTACAVGSYPVEWRVADGGNGHWYRFIPDLTISWGSAKAAASAAGGHLATITASSENAFVFAYLNSVAAWVGVRGPFLGGLQERTASDYSEPQGGWRWVTGELWNSANWAQYGAGEPNNDFGVEDALSMDKRSGSAVWNDVALNGYGGGNQQLGNRTASGYLVEWSSDCNADGIVDYGQILSGSLADTNANGVPDICESTLLV